MSTIEQVAEELRLLKEMVGQLIERRTIKDWYSTAELAHELGKAEWTIRNYCRLSRIKSSRRSCGRGRSKQYMISHEELQRIRNEGFLPDPRFTRVRPR